MTISEGEAELLPAGIGHGTNALIPSMNDVQGMVWFELYELTLNWTIFIAWISVKQ